MTSKILYNQKINNNFDIVKFDNDFVYYKNNDIVIVNDIVNVFDKDNDKVINDFDFDFVKEYIDNNIKNDNIIVNDFIQILDNDFDINNVINNDFVIIEKDNVNNIKMLDNNFVLLSIDKDLYKINSYDLNKYIVKAYTKYEYDKSLIYVITFKNTLNYFLSNLNYCFIPLNNLINVKNYKKQISRLIKVNKYNQNKDKMIKKGQILSKNLNNDTIRSYIINNDCYFDFLNNLKNDCFKSFKNQNKKSLDKEFKKFIDNYKSYINKDNDNDIDFDLLKSKYQYKVNDIDFDKDIDIVIDNDNDNDNDNDIIYLFDKNNNDIVNEYKSLKRKFLILKNSLKNKEAVNNVYLKEHNTLRYNIDNDIDKVIKLSNKMNKIYKNNEYVINKHKVDKTKSRYELKMSLKTLYNDFLHDTFINDYDFNLSIKVYNNYIDKVNDIINDLNNINFDLIDKDLFKLLNTLLTTFENKKTDFIELKNYKELKEYKNNENLKYHNTIHKVNKINFMKIAYDENKENFVTID